MAHSTDKARENNPVNAVDEATQKTHVSPVTETSERQTTQTNGKTCRSRRPSVRTKCMCFQGLLLAFLSQQCLHSCHRDGLAVEHNGRKGKVRVAGSCVAQAKRSHMAPWCSSCRDNNSWADLRGEKTRRSTSELLGGKGTGGATRQTRTTHEWAGWHRKVRGRGGGGGGSVERVGVNITSNQQETKWATSLGLGEVEPLTMEERHKGKGRQRVAGGVPGGQRWQMSRWLQRTRGSAAQPRLLLRSIKPTNRACSAERVAAKLHFVPCSRRLELHYPNSCAHE